MTRTADYPLEFLDLPTSTEHPVAWTINAYDQPTQTHFDVHMGLEIGIVMSGRSRRLYGDFAFETRPGDVWFAGMWEPHGMQILKPGTRHLVLGVLPEFLGTADPCAGCDWLELFRMSPARRPQATSSPDRRYMLNLGRNIERLIQSNDRHRIPRLRLILQQLLLYFMSKDSAKHSAVAVAAPPDSQTQLLDAIRLVEQNLDRKITLEQAGRAAHMSRSRFAEQFRLHMGMTFGAYLTRRRLAGVMWDLRSGDAKIGVLAHRWGFADASHLVRLFHAVTGVTPGAYRKSHADRIQQGRSYHPMRMPKPDTAGRER